MESSLLTKDLTHCYLCGVESGLECHHIFNAFNRKQSTKYKLMIPLCHSCHNEPPNGIHFNKEIRKKVQSDAQKAFESEYPELDFVAIFGKNFKED